MGGQGGMARFLGSCRQLVGYVDDGKVFWRQHGRLDKKRWRTMPSMEGQRLAARYFGAASTVAGDLWSRLPKAMRRMADGGGFNRLVGRFRDLVEYDGRFPALGELAGLDLSADSSGPLVVSGSVSEGFRLCGVRELMQGIDDAVGPGAGQRSGKYVVANRAGDGWEVRESVDWGPLGDCRKWRGKHKKIKKPAVRYEPQVIVTRTKRRTIVQEKFVAVRAPLPCNVGHVHWTGPQRRVRVWVYASEVGGLAWHKPKQKYELVEPVPLRGGGFVTDWLVGSRFVDLEAGIAGWAADYAVNGGLELPPPGPYGTGRFAVFTAVEVAEKRGRHWVRLPWCSRMAVHSVVDNFDMAASEGYVEFAEYLGKGSLVALPARRVEGMDVDWRKSWEFWAAWDGWDGWILWEYLCLSEVDGLVLGYEGAELRGRELAVTMDIGP